MRRIVGLVVSVIVLAWGAQSPAQSKYTAKQDADLRAIERELAHATGQPISDFQPKRGRQLPDASELPTRMPQLHRLWLKQLPVAYRRDPLFRDFQGLTSPSEWRQVGGKRELFFHACRPHECTTGVVGLYSPGDRRVVALLSKTDFRTMTARAEPVGAMTPAERRCLIAAANDGVGNPIDGGC